LKNVADSAELDLWQQDMRVELLQNQSRNLSSRHAQLAGNILDDFPDFRTLDLYINSASHDSDLTAARPLASTCLLRLAAQAMLAIAAL
jgi:hypothetical protein